MKAEFLDKEEERVNSVTLIRILGFTNATLFVFYFEYSPSANIATYCDVYILFKKIISADICEHIYRLHYTRLREQPQKENYF